MPISFNHYGSSMALRHIPLADLLKAAEAGDVFARSEDSGCEGVYVEVAKWNGRTNRWERFVFDKLFGGEDLTPEEQDAAPPGDERLSAWATADRVTARINAASRQGYVALVHHFPDYKE